MTVRAMRQLREPHNPRPAQAQSSQAPCTIQSMCRAWPGAPPNQNPGSGTPHKSCDIKTWAAAHCVSFPLARGHATLAPVVPLTTPPLAAAVRIAKLASASGGMAWGNRVVEAWTGACQQGAFPGPGLVSSRLVSRTHPCTLPMPSQLLLAGVHPCALGGRCWLDAARCLPPIVHKPRGGVSRAGLGVPP